MGLRSWLGRIVGGKSLIHEVSSAYEAAQANYSRGIEGSPLRPSYNEEDERDRVQMMKETRQLRKDYQPIEHGIKEVAKYISPKAFRSTIPDRDAAKLVNDYIAKHMEAERFDYAQANDFSCGIRGLLLDFFTDGDAFGRMIRPRGERGFYTQTIRADLIGGVDGSDVMRMLTEPTKAKSRYRVISGAVLDSRMRRIAWEKYREIGQGKRYSAAGYEFEARIKGRALFQVFDPDHSDAIRGITPFHGSIAPIKDIKTIWDYEQDSQKAYASLPYFVKNDTGTAKKSRVGSRLDNSNESKCPTCEKDPCKCAPRTEEVEGARLIYLKYKEEIQAFQHNRPNGTFLEFSKWLLSQGAMSLSLPYSILYDASGLNGGALRFELGRATTSILYLRNMVVERRILPAMGPSKDPRGDR